MAYACRNAVLLLGHGVLARRNPSHLPPASPAHPLTFGSSFLTSSASTAARGAETVRAFHPRVPAPGPVVSEGRDEDERHLICPGCGIVMQDADPDLPGFYLKPRAVAEAPGGDGEPAGEIDLILDADDDDGELGSDTPQSYDSDGISANKMGESTAPSLKFDLVSGWEEPEFGDEKRSKELDGFTLPGVGFGNITEEKLQLLVKERVTKSEKKRKLREAQRSEAAAVAEVTVCARCHALRNYGQVKNPKAENLIPDFDFDRFVATRLMKKSGGVGAATVVVLVVDCVDFDGSFPKLAVRSLFKALEGDEDDATFKLVLVPTKVDLLPSQISPARLDRWVRDRAKAAGAPRLSTVYLVSTRKDLGVRNLISYIKHSAGPRGHVWVVGAQNAGKSTLINAFAKREGVMVTRLTEAPIPGTTLGILRISGVLRGKARLYDTPGLLHQYLITARLNREEQKMVEIRKELRPRTFRVKAGQTVHLGALARLDLVQASIETIYITVWASPNISLHLGKIENADKMRSEHFGIRLQPPVGQARVKEIGPWVRSTFQVSGTSWDVNSVDIAVAGLGWFSLGLKGEAHVELWTFDGVEVTQRDPLVLDRAPVIERPGFLLPTAVSDAVGKVSGPRKKQSKQGADFLLEQA